MSYQQDYILRLIENVGVMLQRIMDLMQRGKAAEALVTTDEAVGILVGVDSPVVDSMTVSSVATFLMVGAELDVPRCILLARLWAERAEALEVEGDAEGGRRQRVRAAELLRLATDEARGEEAEEIRTALAEIFAAEE